MTNTVLHVPRFAPPVSAPRSTAPGFGLRIWRALEAMGQRRAAAELRRLAASRRVSDPELAQWLLAAVRATEQGAG